MDADTNIEGESCRQCDKLELTLERVMRDGRNKVDELEREVRRQQETLGALVAWLKNREQWLTNEISGGGNWEHLNIRRSECAYIRERFERLSSHDGAPK